MARQKERHATANAARSREAITDDRGWVDAASRSWADYLIERWWATTPPEPMVGSRHHTVPRSYLERFAAAGQIYVRDRVTGIGALRNVKDTGAIKDFYTSINLDGQLDGRLERILSDIEGGAETVFRRLLNPFRKPRSLDPDEHLHVCIFLAFQLVRTPRHRREMELMGDYVIRATHESTPGIADVRVVPDPNLHLEYFTKNAPKLAEALFDRPTTLLTIDSPLFITADEPVILEMAGNASHVQHLATCYQTPGRDRQGIGMPDSTQLKHGDTIHVYPSRPGVDQAAAVAIPLNPRTLLTLGPKGEHQGQPHHHLHGEEAMDLAEDVNALLITHAYQWVAAHPEHRTFAGMVFSEPTPIIQVCDGGTQFARDLDRPPEPRQPQLRGRRGW